jgi:hypothetical protein
MEIARMNDGEKLVSALVDALSRKADVIPPGFKSKNQLVKETGKSLKRSEEIIRLGVRNGILEVRKFKVFSKEMSRIFHIPHYRLK